MAGVLLLAAALAACARDGPRAVFTTPQGVRHVDLELAVTEAARARGMMFRSRMEEGQGMLFVFPDDDRPSFWMKNTYLSLDILFLSRKGRIVDLFEKVPPCGVEPCPLYTPEAPVRYALELPAGFAAGHGVRKGDRVSLENLPP